MNDIWKDFTDWNDDWDDDSNSVDSVDSVDKYNGQIKNDDSENSYGFNQKDVDLVMQQGNTSRFNAIAFLKKNNGDIVSAIMETLKN